MTDNSRYSLKNGQTLVTLNGYRGEDDFYRMYDIIKEIVSPDHIKYGVDSMCVDGSFQKDGMTVRMSSESAYDYMCLMYDEKSLPDGRLSLIDAWISEITERLHQWKAPREAEEEDW